MKNYIAKRAEECAQYILRKNATIRMTAKVFCVSKSTVHKDVSERLPQIDAHLAAQVKTVLDKNLAERHLRGGEATRKKFKKQIL